MIPNILSAVLLLALSVAAKPMVLNKSPVTLPISRRTNFTSVHNLLRHDQARAKFLKANGLAKATGLTFQYDDVINEPIYNQAVGYYASVGVGSPPTTYMLHIDTGRYTNCDPFPLSLANKSPMATKFQYLGWS